MEDKNLKCDPESKKKESEENVDVNKSVNCIVVKPEIKIDVDISGLVTKAFVG